MYDQRCVGGIPGAGTMPVYVFEDFEIDLERFELRHQGEPVAIGPRAFDVLAYLIRHRERTVSKQELVSRVWGVVAIELCGSPDLYRRGAQGARRSWGAKRSDRHRPQAWVPVRGNGSDSGRSRNLDGAFEVSLEEGLPGLPRRSWGESASWPPWRWL